MKVVNPRFYSLSKKTKLYLVLFCIGSYFICDYITNGVFSLYTMGYFPVEKAFAVVFGILFGWVGVGTSYIAAVLCDILVYVTSGGLSFGGPIVIKIMLLSVEDALLSICAFYIWGLLNRRYNTSEIDSYKKVYKFIAVSAGASIISGLYYLVICAFYNYTFSEVSYIFTRFLSVFEMSVMAGLPLMVLVPRLGSRVVMKRKGKITLLETEKIVLLLFPIEVFIFAFFVLRYLINSSTIDTLTLYSSFESMLCEEFLFIVLVVLFSASSGRNSSALKLVQKISFVIMSLCVVGGIILIKRFELLSVNIASSVNVILYVCDLAVCAIMVLANILDQQKQTQQGVLFFMLVSVHCVSLAGYAAGTINLGLGGSEEFDAMLHLLMSIMDFVMLSVIIRFDFSVLGIVKKQYRRAKLCLNIDFLLYILSCFIEVAVPELSFLSYLTWWTACLIMTVIILREGRTVFMKAVLLGLTLLGTIFELLKFLNVSFLVAPIGDLCGIIMVFEGMYVGRSNSLSETEKDLSFASSVQLSMLPRDFALENFRNLDLYASMRSAKEVGGDFYDFYKVSPKHIVFVVADVSGKGTPGAMMMMRAITAIKNFAMAGFPVDKIMQMASDNINEHNNAMLFVTAWMGLLNVETGKLRFVNAGHNPPIIRHADRSTEELKTTPDPVMGFFPGNKYTKQTIFLKPGDTLFLYTDGVTEAFNEHDEQYGMARLHMALGAEYADSKELCLGVTSSVDGFVGEADQFDDMTMLAIQFKYNRTEEACEEASVLNAASTIAFEEYDGALSGLTEVHSTEAPIEIEIIKPDSFNFGEGQSFAEIIAGAEGIDISDEEDDAAVDFGAVRFEEISELPSDIHFEEIALDADEIVLDEETAEPALIELDEEVAAPLEIELDESGFAPAAEKIRRKLAENVAFEKLIESVASKTKVAEITYEIDDFAMAAGASLDQLSVIDICFDEVFSNVANYAYDGEAGPCRITLKRLKGPNGIALVISDSGIPYNPLTKADPSMERSLEERTLGGVGIFMVKKYMDDVRYEYSDNENRLTLVKFFEE